MPTISERALIARINRKLLLLGHQLHKCREDSRWFAETGEFFIHNEQARRFETTDVDLEALGRELGVMRETETLAD